MIQEGEQFKEADNEIKLTIEAKNNLEALIYQYKETLSKESIKEKIGDTDFNLMTDTITELETWLLDEKTKEEYESKLTEINDKMNPIMMKVYSENSEMPTFNPATMDPSASMPTVDEVD